MFGLVDLVVRAERELRDNTIYARDEGRFDPWAWLQHHKVFWLAAAGVLALLIIGGNAA
jgi:hypothetical protein